MSDDIKRSILFIQKTLDMNQEMLDALYETSQFMLNFCEEHGIPVPRQQQLRINSLAREIRSLGERMVEHVKEFRNGVNE